MKKFDSKCEEVNLFICFVSCLIRRKTSAVDSDRGRNDGGAEEKAVEEIAVVRFRITVQVIQQYSRLQGIQIVDTGLGGEH